MDKNQLASEAKRLNCTTTGFNYSLTIQKSNSRPSTEPGSNLVSQKKTDILNYTLKMKRE